MDDTYRYHRICSVIENIMKTGGANRNIILYPFGYNGFLFKLILNERYGYREKLLIDNKLSNKNPDVISMDNLCPQDIDRTTWLVFTLEDSSRWEEIYNDIPNFIPREKIVILFEDVHKHNKRNSVPQVQDCTSTDLYYRGCVVGRHTSGYKDFITLPGLCERIGRFCAIARTARIVGNHPIDMVFVSSLFYAPPESNSKVKLDGADDSLFARRSLLCHQYGQQKFNPDFPFSLGSLLSKNTPCAIGNDVWIGHNVTIMPGTEVCDGAVLAAGAVVTHDVPPYTIVAGVPAKKIRTRFSNDMINELLKIKWWEWSDEKIIANYELFYNPKAFVEKFR